MDIVLCQLIILPIFIIHYIEKIEQLLYACSYKCYAGLESESEREITHMNKIKKKLLTEKSYWNGSYCLAPEFLSLLLTFECNFQCQACSIWKKKNEEELNPSQWQSIIEKLKNFLDKKTFVEINGGEPLLRKELCLDAIRELKKHFAAVTLNSNGSMLDQPTVGQLKAVGLDTIKISLYSLDEKTHDSLRGFPGAFQKAKHALELISRSLISLEVGVLVTNRNIKGIPELAGFLQQFPRVKIILQPLDESIESAESKDRQQNFLPRALWPKAAEVEALFEWVKENNKIIKNSTVSLRAMKNYYLNPPGVLSHRCFAGQRSVIVQPDGQVSLCFKGRSIGNIEQDNAEDIFNNAAAKEERKNIRQCQKYCRIGGCNFSRGIKEWANDWLRMKE